MSTENYDILREYDSISNILSSAISNNKFVYVESATVTDRNFILKDYSGNSHQYYPGRYNDGTWKWSPVQSGDNTVNGDLAVTENVDVTGTTTLTGDLIFNDGIITDNNSLRFGSDTTDYSLFQHNTTTGLLISNDLSFTVDVDGSGKELLLSTQNSADIRLSASRNLRLENGGATASIVVDSSNTLSLISDDNMTLTVGQDFTVDATGTVSIDSDTGIVISGDEITLTSDNDMALTVGQDFTVDVTGAISIDSDTGIVISGDEITLTSDGDLDLNCGILDMTTNNTTLKFGSSRVGSYTSATIATDRYIEVQDSSGNTLYITATTTQPT